MGHFQADARTILAAKALLLGSYSDLQLPGRPPLNFPLPGFPLFLVPFVALLSSCVACLKIIPMMFTLGSALNAYGVAALFSGQHLATARLRLMKAVRQTQNYGVAWLNLARIDVRLGDRVHARQAFDRALEQPNADQDQAFMVPIALQERQSF